MRPFLIEMKLGREARRALRGAFWETVFYFDDAAVRTNWLFFL